ncbi:MAG: glucosaminidase domain-containing protein [Ferruginibacter sp.]
MIKKIFQLIFITGFFMYSVNGQTLTPEQYIAQYKDIAIREMKRMGVPAAITLAQGILETECGNSLLVKKSNNHFGIKCKSTWTSGSVSHDDDAPGECFRTYKNAEDSYRDHSNFLRGSERYSFLFDLNPTDYKGWANGLKKAGYATNPKYPNILIKHIEQYDLQQYSISGATGMARYESAKFKDDPVVFDMDQTIQNDRQPEVNAVIPGTGENKKDENGLLLSETLDKINFINGSKCINARKGTSLLAIATLNNISLHKLLEINELEEDGILDEDQLIFLEKKSKTGDKDYCIVQKKKSLYEVAQENGIQLESLLEYNHLNEDGVVYPGTKIYLKAIAGSDTPEMLQNNTTASKAILYQVHPKESLYAVARKYHVTVKQLKEWNNLASDDLKIGQQLIVGK